MPTSPQTRSCHPCSGPSRALVWGAIAVVFAAGFALGAGWWAWKTADPFGSIIRDPDQAPKRLAELIRSELGLTAEQTAAVEKLSIRHFDAIDDLRSEIHPRFRAELDSFEADVRALLSEPQAAAWKALRARWSEKMPPPPRGAAKRAAEGAAGTAGSSLSNAGGAAPAGSPEGAP